MIKLSNFVYPYFKKNNTTALLYNILIHHCLYMYTLKFYSY